MTKYHYLWFLALACVCVAAGVSCGGANGGSSSDRAAPDASPNVDDDDDNDNDNDVSPSVCRTTPGPQGSTLIVLSNGLIEVAFNRADGVPEQIRDMRRNPPLRLLRPTRAGIAPPYELYEIARDQFWKKYFNIEKASGPTAPPAAVCTDTTVEFTWAASDQPVVSATWSLTDGAPEAQVRARVTNVGKRMIYSLRYPILPQVTALSPAAPGDILLLPLEGGLQVSRPLVRLREEIRDGGCALGAERYPGGHQAMAQLEALLHAGVGGLLLYTADPGFGSKEFEFTARPPLNGGPHALTFPTWQIMHWNPDINAAEFAPDYPVVLRWLDRGTWDEAAEIYREWSDKQVWAQSPLATRAPAERRFFERVGASIFGLSARVDQRAWVNAFRQALVDDVANAQLLFVFGWDFHPLGAPTEPQYYIAMQQAGRDPAFWSPLVGATQANIAQAQQQGDLASLFYYDLLVDSGTPGWNGLPPPTGWNEGYWPHLVYSEFGLPGGVHMKDDVNHGMIFTLDPADPFVADFWKWRDRLVVSQSTPPVDALYFDLGFNVALTGSYDSLAGLNHGHPSGAGGWQPQAVRKILDDTRGMANPRGYRYGAENVTEPYFDLVDFWHLGEAGLGPLVDKVGGSDPPKFTSPASWIMSGAAVPTPLLPYLAHHLGALRTGGKMEIGPEMGEAFYWLTFAEYLWGGVVELIYFNTPVEWLPTLDPQQACDGLAERCGFETNWGRSDTSTNDRGWHADADVNAADPALLAFLKNAIRLRVNSPATPYLTLGRMEAPPTFDPEPPPYPFSYSYYFSIGGPDSYHNGTWSAAPLRAVAWRHPTENKIALLAANASGETIATALVADLSRYGMAGGAVAETDLDSGGSHLVLTADTQRDAILRLPITLGPRAVKMWEITPAPHFGSFPANARR